MMRKNTKAILLLLALCMAFTLALTACGPKTVEDVNAKIDKYIASVQSELDEVNDSLGDAMEMTVSSRDGSLVYVYQFKTDLGISNEEAAKTLSEGLAEQASAFDTVLSELKKAVPGAVSVIVEYTDQNGEIIISEEYK